MLRKYNPSSEKVHSPINKLNEIAAGLLYLIEKRIAKIRATKDDAPEIIAYLESFFSSRAFVVILAKRE